MRKAMHAVILSSALVVLAGSGALGADRSKVQGSFVATGTEPGASGFIKSDIGSKSRLKLKFKGLAPAASYSLHVGGVEEAAFVASSTGSAKLQFRTQPSGNDLPLDFDSRGQEVELRNGADDVLAVTLGSAGGSPGVSTDERTLLAPTALAAGGTAAARFRQRSDGRTTFKVEIEDVPAGSYTLFVDGIQRALITVSAGQGEVEFDSQASPPKLPLDFDPRGLVIDIAQGTDIFFSGPMLAQAPGVTTCAFTQSEQMLTSTGADPDAEAKARLRTRDDCDRDFEVEAEDLPVGAYDLYVAGVLRGTITVASVVGGTKGEVEFKNPVEPGKVLLDFDPSGAVIEIRQGATTFFSAVFTGSFSEPTTCDPSETLEDLSSTGADPDASGSTRLRVDADCARDFSVEVEDLPVGTYDLFVGGILRASIDVVTIVGGAKGEVEFADPIEPGKILLDFDPSGAVIEVRQGATTFFSHQFGSGSGGGGTPCQPTEVEVPLLNAGPQPQAKGKARWRLDDDCSVDFRVEIEDLPLGNYDLVVGGVVRGTVTVLDVAGEHLGEIEFASPIEPGTLLLDFDPRGQDVTIGQAAVVFLVRQFPN